MRSRPAAVRFRPPDTVLAALFGLLVVASDFEFRRRDVNQATSGAVDVAVLLELGVYALVGGWFALTAARAPGRTARPRLMQLLCALSAVLAASALWAPTPTLALARSFELVVSTGFVAYVAARAVRRTWHEVAHAFVVVVTIGVLIGLVYRRPPQLQLSGRFMWLYGHPVVAASMLTLSSLLLLGWLFDHTLPRRWTTPVYAGLCLLHTAALFATETRGSLVAWLIGVVVFAWLRMPRSAVRGSAAITLLALPPLIGLSLPILRVVALRGETAGQLRSLNSRAGLWQAAWEAFRARPILGQGYFASRELFLDTIGLGGAHNAFIEIGLSAGLVGLGLFVAVLVVLVRRLRAIGRHPDRPMIAAAVVALLVNGLTAQYFAQAGTAANLMFLLLVGWVSTLEPLAARGARHAGDAQPSSAAGVHAEDATAETRQEALR